MEPATYAPRAYIPFHPAVKSSQPRFVLSPRGVDAHGVHCLAGDKQFDTMMCIDVRVGCKGNAKDAVRQIFRPFFAFSAKRRNFAV